MGSARLNATNACFRFEAANEAAAQTRAIEQFGVSPGAVTSVPSVVATPSNE